MIFYILICDFFRYLLNTSFSELIKVPPQTGNKPVPFRYHLNPNG